MLQENQIYLGDCLQLMKQITDKSIDCVITSPPYDNIRTYNGSINWSFEIFQEIAKELYRVLNDGSVLVWVVGDATENGSETDTSFKQALYFKEIGFNLHDTMIYSKNGIAFPNPKRYHQCFEYMFILSKGMPKSVTLIEDRKNSLAGEVKGSRWERMPDGEIKFREKDGYTMKEYGARWNIWEYEIGYMKSSKDKLAFQHPAIFPERLAKDHILSWTHENDLILDPFLGSGTTAIAAYDLKRRYIGIEKEPKYFEIAKKRIADFEAQGRLF